MGVDGNGAILGCVHLNVNKKLAAEFPVLDIIWPSVIRLPTFSQLINPRTWIADIMADKWKSKSSWGAISITDASRLKSYSDFRMWEHSTTSGATCEFSFIWNSSFLLILSTMKKHCFFSFNGTSFSNLVFLCLYIGPLGLFRAI